MACIGFTCAYTPLPLVAACGYTPFRVLPATEVPDQAGSILHDNLCPHVKRVLDRAVAGDLPDLAGILLVSSCDAMRRLADAWRTARPADRIAEIHLPHVGGEPAVSYLAAELRRLASSLAAWSGSTLDEARLWEETSYYDALARRLENIADRASQKDLPRSQLQELFNASVSLPPRETERLIETFEQELKRAPAAQHGVPVLVAGNVLPAPEALALFESCGVRVVGDDLCTGERQLCPTPLQPGEDPLLTIARALLARPLCARTIDTLRPGQVATQIVARARTRGARGVIMHVMKFCDPYFGRLPLLQRALVAAGLPTLVLEGDTTLRSLGQQSTRIEAFAEMLSGGSA